MFHGAALIQVAEHKRFTAINSLKTGRKVHRNAYKINNDIGLYLKYASGKTKAHKEYIFTFTLEHLKDIKKIHQVTPRLFIAMVCVEDREICCLSYDELCRLVETRKNKKGSQENQYSILMTILSGNSIHVYVNAPGVKNTKIGKDMIIKRKEYPNKIFS